MYSYNQISPIFGVSHLGGKCNLTIYISNINRGDIVTGLEAIRKEGTIIRTEFRARLGQIIPVDRRRSTGAPTPE